MISSGDGGRGEKGHDSRGEGGDEAGSGAKPSGEVGLEGHLIDIAEGLTRAGLAGLVHDACVFPKELGGRLVEYAGGALEPLLGVIGLCGWVSRVITGRMRIKAERTYLYMFAAPWSQMPAL